MKALIYQCWDGTERPGNLAGVEAMAVYADRIGADHIYEHDPKFRTDLGSYSPNYGKFKPLFVDAYRDYDYVMYADCDVNPIDGLHENVFEQVADTSAEVGICEEWNAPKARLKHTIAGINNTKDEKWVQIVEKKWHVKLPRTEDGEPKIYNTGVIVYSNDGMTKCNERFFDFGEYVKLIRNHSLPPFYTCDQPFFHAMLEVCDLAWTTMDYKWNSSVHFDPGVKQHPRPVIDLRDNANFVHIQLGGADHWDADKIYRVTNLSVSEWNL